MAVYKLFWDGVLLWYLEMIKPVYGQPINKKVYDTDYRLLLIICCICCTRFMPFITSEELAGTTVDP